MGYPRFQRARNFKYLNTTTAPTVTSSTFAATPGFSDLTIAAQAGDVLQAGVNSQWGNDPFGGRGTVATIVSGSVVTILGDSSYGIGAWYGAASVYTGIGVPIMFTLTASDISNGNVTVRFMTKVDSGSKTLTSVAQGNQFWVRNLGPADGT